MTESQRLPRSVVTDWSAACREATIARAHVSTPSVSARQSTRLALREVSGRAGAVYRIGAYRGIAAPGTPSYLVAG